MKRKNLLAFTLAEVLITLTILGVVAAITVPNMIRSYKMKAVETQLKKSYSDLSNALSMACAENNTDIVHLVDKAVVQSSPREYFAENYLEPYLRRNKKHIKGKDNEKNIFITSDYYDNIKNLAGTKINVALTNPIDWIQYANPNSSFIGLFYESNHSAYNFIIDVNGLKGPNTIGYDIFYFAVSASSGGGDNSYLKKNQLACGRLGYKWEGSCNGEGYFCSCPIMKNNWKFPKDYPVKF